MIAETHWRPQSKTQRAMEIIGTYAHRFWPHLHASEQVQTILDYYKTERRKGRLPRGMQEALANQLGVPKYVVNDVGRGRTYIGDRMEKSR